MQNYMGNVMQAFQGGQQMRQQMDTRKALGALTSNPEDAGAMQLLSRANPQMAMQFQQRQAEQRKAQLAEAREKLILTGRLMDGATPEDYAQRLQAAQSMGLDVSNVPQQYDPNWIAQSQMQVRALLGKVEQELMAVAPGTVVFDKTSRQPVYQNPAKPRFYAVPPGGMLVPEPGAGQSVAPPVATPQPGQVEDGYRFRGGNPADPNAWEPVGDAGGNASGGFPQ